MKRRKPDDKPLREYFTTVFHPAKLARRNAKTAYQYTLNLDRFDNFLERVAKLSDLNDGAVNQFLAHLKEEGFAPSSVEKARDNLCCMWRYFNELRIVDSWPCVDEVVVPVKIPVAWTPPELKRLWEFLERIPGDVGGIPANLWFLAVVSILWDTGARITPVLKAKWDQVDLTTGFFIERSETRKGGMCDKLGRLHPETCAILRDIATPVRDLIVPWPYSPHSLWNRWHEITRRAGIRSGTKFAFHCIRKSVATHVKIGGGNATEALGHYDPRMTEQVYIDPTQAIKSHASDVLFRLHQRPTKSAGGDNAAK